jgi:hypothetical protein
VVGVAQLVELLVVVQAVGGSSPLAHPPEMLANGQVFAYVFVSGSHAGVQLGSNFATSCSRNRGLDSYLVVSASRAFRSRCYVWLHAGVCAGAPATSHSTAEVSPISGATPYLLDIEVARAQRRFDHVAGPKSASTSVPAGVFARSTPDAARPRRGLGFGGVPVAGHRERRLLNEAHRCYPPSVAP